MGNGDRAPTPTERLLALFDQHRLSPTQRRIAQHLLDHLPDAAFLSSVDLATQVGVSQPSVTRFAVALGFSGYPDLQRALRPIAMSAAANHPDPETVRRNELQAAVDAEIRNLEALRQSLIDPSRVLEVGRELANSTPLTVLGARISAPIADYFGYAAKRIHPDVRVVTSGGSAAYDALLQSREAGGEWVLAFALPRYAGETIAALRYARQVGLRTAVVTDAPIAPFADEVDVLLAAGVGTRLVFDSYAAPVTLAAVVLQAMADADPARTQARLEAYEGMAEGVGFFTDR
ncbi:MurR/RpiR family transcriptional regulator [Cryptosporangium minutisporangium]|uniref:MurR/RpiR family transcriptional regulator n=1 Tax=Cryptosporangium minutisporangium TaxID=113569 RepID=A0ABP6STF8_9ACTN